MKIFKATRGKQYLPRGEKQFERQWISHEKQSGQKKVT